jgi:hypothetical protein
MRAPPTPSKISVTSMRRKRNDAAANAHRTSNAGAVEIATDSGCVIATLRRPATRNRISGAMARELMDLAESVEDDESALALAITGAGPAF